MPLDYHQQLSELLANVGSYSVRRQLTATAIGCLAPAAPTIPWKRRAMSLPHLVSRMHITCPRYAQYPRTVAKALPSPPCPAPPPPPPRYDDSTHPSCGPLQYDADVLVLSFGTSW